MIRPEAGLLAEERNNMPTKSHRLDAPDRGRRQLLAFSGRLSSGYDARHVIGALMQALRRGVFA
jgi:hypothetical protein